MTVPTRPKATPAVKERKVAAIKKKTLNGRTRKDPTDAHVGQQLRLRRSDLGFSQEKLAGMVGVSFQQIQKYENGINRVSMGRIKQLATALDVPFSYFFAGLAGSEALMPTPQHMVAEETHAAFADDLLSRKESVALLKAYYALPEAERAKVLALVEKLLSAAK